MEKSSILKKTARAAAVFSAVYAFASSSGFHDRRRWRGLTGWDYAHRGLHDIKRGIPENSMAAFRAAVAGNYAIELDVRLTADNRLVVMHDNNLLRMCRVNKRISHMLLEDLSVLRLTGTDQTIPLFSDVLDMVGGRVPLLIEIKAEETSPSLICPLVWQLLSKYDGPYLIESFNPLVLLWFRFHQPAVVRGQLSCDFFRESPHADIALFLVTNLMTNFLTHPDFISYKYLDMGVPAFILNQKVMHAMTALWTIHNRPAYEKYKKKCDIVIFEGFRP